MSNPIVGITIDIEGEYFKTKADYATAITRAGGVPILIPAVGSTSSYAEMIDALLIPGGRDLNPSYYHEEMLPVVKPVSRQRSDFEISLLKDVLRDNKPILGICYGMQLINVIFGGTLYQDIDTQFPSSINHREGYHKVLIEENRFIEKGEFSVNSSHHQAIKELGESLVGFAFSQDKHIEAFCGKDQAFLVGIQWHPERLLDEGLSTELFKVFIEAARGKSEKS